MKEFNTKSTLGIHISAVAAEAIKAAQDEDVFFIFNEICVPVTKTSTVESVCQIYDQLFAQAAEAYKNSPAYVEAQERERQRAEDAHWQLVDDIYALKTADELTLRDLSLRPRSIEDLQQIFTNLSERSHDYGTCVYAMSILAEASFNLMAAKLGVTGFQASCADLDIIRRTRSIDGPFSLLLGRDMLYPQYDIQKKVTQCLTEWQPWAANEAKKLLESRQEHVHPNVLAHWERLAVKAATDEKKSD